MVDSYPGVDSSGELFPALLIVYVQQIEDIVVMSKIAIDHPLNRFRPSLHFIIDFALVSETHHWRHLILHQMRLEHTSEVVLVSYRVPLEHTSSKDSVCKLVVSNNLVNTSYTSCNSTTWGFNDLLKYSEIQVVEETRRDIDWIARKPLYHLDNRRCVESCNHWSALSALLGKL